MKQSYTWYKLFFLLISSLSCHILAQSPTSSYTPIVTQNNSDNSPEILKQMGNILISFINLSQKTETNTEDVVPVLAQAFSSMLNIAALASKRSISSEEQIALLTAFLQTEPGKNILEQWRSLITQQEKSLS